MKARKVLPPRDRLGRFVKAPQPPLDPVVLKRLRRFTVRLSEPANVLEELAPFRLLDSGEEVRP
jgi:hypothetical protein